MVVLRLFHQSDPFRQIDARELDEGEIAVGRDSAADWTIEDSERAVSRIHCVLARTHGRLTVRDTSANGVFVGAERTRLPCDQAAPVRIGETLRLGEFLIVVEAADAPAPETAAAPTEPDTPDGSGAFDAPFSRPILQPQVVSEAALSVPTDWAVLAKPGPSDGSLLDAFCAGAHLDASAFAGENPAEVMARLGSVYRQMVLGLCDQMSERSSVKAEYRLTRTTIHADGNNPFKWASPERIAVDLLRARDDGFLTGPAPVRAAFEDMKKHLLCVLAGLRAALGVTLDALSPEAAEAEIKGQSFVLKNRSSAAWAEYVRLYAQFRQQADDNADSPINREFRAGYERQLQELDAMVARP